MNEQDLESLMNAVRRRGECTKKAQEILSEIVYKVKVDPDALAILVELRYLLQMMENIHQAREDRKPVVRHV